MLQKQFHSPIQGIFSFCVHPDFISREQFQLECSGVDYKAIGNFPGSDKCNFVPVMSAEEDYGKISMPVQGKHFKIQLVDFANHALKINVEKYKALLK